MYKKPFLRWALMLSLMIVGVVVGAWLGWIKLVWLGDTTKMTLAVGVVFVTTTALCGRLRWKLNGLVEAAGMKPAERDRVLDGIERNVQHGWFASSVCVTIGLLGTVVGLFMMLQGVPEGGAEAAAALAE